MKNFYKENTGLKLEVKGKTFNLDYFKPTRFAGDVETGAVTITYSFWPDKANRDAGYPALMRKVFTIPLNQLHVEEVMLSLANEANNLPELSDGVDTVNFNGAVEA